MALVEQVYRLCLDLPSDEKFGLISQLKRAAVSIPANIAEGYGRESAKAFAHFIRISVGSSYELRTLIELAFRLDIATEAKLNAVRQEAYEIGRMLTAFVRHLESKSTSVREDSAEYADEF